MCTNAVYQPPLNSQMILQITFRQPLSLLLLTTALPKGHNTSPAILKHCRPQGMPSTVIHNNTPEKKYPSAANKPPKMSQSRFNGKFVPCIKVI